MTSFIQLLAVVVDFWEGRRDIFVPDTLYSHDPTQLQNFWFLYWPFVNRKLIIFSNLPVGNIMYWCFYNAFTDWLFKWLPAANVCLTDNYYLTLFLHYGDDSVKQKRSSAGNLGLYDLHLKENSSSVSTQSHSGWLYQNDLWQLHGFDLRHILRTNHNIWIIKRRHYFLLIQVIILALMKSALVFCIDNLCTGIYTERQI